MLAFAFCVAHGKQMQNSCYVTLNRRWQSFIREPALEMCSKKKYSWMPMEEHLIMTLSTYHGDSILRERSSPQKLTSNFDHRVECLKLEEEIDQTLQALRKSLEFEYRLAEERLLKRTMS